jgi:hypothetical protein
MTMESYLNCTIPTMPLSLHLKAWQRSLKGLYHSNNASVFTSEGMAEKLKRFAQIIMFAGTDSELVTFHHKFHHSRNNRQTVTTPGMSRMLSCEFNSEFNINTIHLLILGLDVHHSLGPVALN